MGKIFCLGVAGGSIDKKLGEVLFANAYDMIETQTKKQRIKGKNYDGWISTDFERATLVTITGILFSASVLTPKGEMTAGFIVRDQDLEGIEKAEIHILRSKKRARAKKDNHLWN